VKFQFKSNAQYVEALETLLRYNAGFTHNMKTLNIDLAPADHDQLPIYDEFIVDLLNKINANTTNDDGDELLAQDTM